ncbi:MAG: c-type cytochrome [Rhodanobacteraceae bacterium]
MHIPGSARSYTAAELGTNFVAPDWFPQDHPPAPHVVLYGRKPAWACGACHQPNGEGDIASPALAGLPKAYIVEQIKAFRDGQRAPPNPEMAEEARNLDDADLQQAVDYFSGLKLPPSGASSKPRRYPRRTGMVSRTRPPTTARANPSANASSKSPTTRSSTNGAMSTPASSPTCRPAASRAAR